MFGLFLAGVACLAVYSPVFMSPTMNWWGRSWLALFFLLFILIAVIDTNGLIAKTLRNRVLGSFGNISYGVYLIHQVVFSFCLAFLFPNTEKTASLLLLASIVSFLFVIGIASLLYQLVEKPIIGLGHRIKY
jgi:peptidoglycan/LPS O-acetylase OafA/YrhL